MDWSTVLLSAGVSAIVGAVVSIVAVSQVTVRRAQAESRYQAAQQIKALVAPEIARVVKYQAGMDEGQRREGGRYHSADFVMASQVLAIAESLGWLRRRFVRRRCRLVYGAFTTRLAEVSPTDGASLGSVMAPLMSATYGGGDPSGSADNLLDGRAYEAMTEDHEAPEVKRFLRDLRRLASCR